MEIEEYKNKFAETKLRKDLIIFQTVAMVGRCGAKEYEGKYGTLTLYKDKLIFECDDMPILERPIKKIYYGEIIYKCTAGHGFVINSGSMKYDDSYVFQTPLEENIINEVVEKYRKGEQEKFLEMLKNGDLFL